MTSVQTVGGGTDAGPDEIQDAPPPAQRRLTWLVDVAVVGAYVALAVFVMSRVWRDPETRVLSSNEDDHGLHTLLVAYAERFLFHFENPLYSNHLNAPTGVNMMANTSMFALTIPVAPITHFVGPAVGAVLLLTLGMAGTAAAWYVVLRRHLVRHRVAAAVGGLWCGFAPTMVSHANGQINFVAHFLVPFIVARVLMLREPGRVVRNGVVLGVLIVLQIFINEETLLFTAMALGVFVLAYAVMRPREALRMARPMLGGLGVAVAVSLPLVAYPLWFQFFGRGHYRGLPYEPDRYVTDLASYAAFARQSLAGSAETAKRLSSSATEDNAFFGWPVLILLLVSIVVLWRSVAARATAITGVVFAVLSLGPRLVFDGEDTGIWMPFSLIKDVPIIDLVSVTRLAMVVSFIAGILLALGTDWMAETKRAETKSAETKRAGTKRVVQVAWGLALVAALIPVAPRPEPVRTVAPLPAFLADGTWKSYVPEGRTLVPVPLPGVTFGRTGQRWLALSGVDFTMPRGYFMGPADPPGDLTGAWGPPQRPTSYLLQSIEQGRRPRIDAKARQAAVADLRYWKAAILVLGEAKHQDRLRQAVTTLTGIPPRFVGGVWVWDVRAIGS